MNDKNLLFEIVLVIALVVVALVPHFFPKPQNCCDGDCCPCDPKKDTGAVVQPDTGERTPSFIKESPFEDSEDE